jgi:hypothetical protein
MSSGYGLPRLGDRFVQHDALAVVEFVTLIVDHEVKHGTVGKLRGLVKNQATALNARA